MKILSKEAYQFGDWLFSPRINTLYKVKKSQGQIDDNEIIIAPHLGQLPHRIADPQFTPDGKLSYVMRRFNSDIVSKNVIQPPTETRESTSQIATIIASTQQDWHPSLSPDGQSLAFMSNRTGNTEI